MQKLNLNQTRKTRSSLSFYLMKLAEAEASSPSEHSESPSFQVSTVGAYCAQSFSYREGGSFKNGPQVEEEAHVVRLISKLMLICFQKVMILKIGVCNSSMPPILGLLISLLIWCLI
uniref:Uncharacterized protein n=1 Tax=Glossina austeni TaxID=7395 RepID=A0A1A9V0L6_GLOAU